MADDFRILFADDEETFLFSTCDLLRREGYQCQCASDVADAQSLLADSDYDLVIADIKMPGNSDLEFIRDLARTAEGLPVILVTGHPSVASAVKSVELPVVAYLVKPFDFNELLAKVRTAEQHAAALRAVKDELNRLREYGRSLRQIEAGLQQSTRGTQTQALQAFVALTLRNVIDGLANLQGTFGASESEGQESVASHWTSPLPNEFREVLRDAVATLERTKSAFKSKDLGELRRKLEGLLKS